jgi:hypothetical protein
MPRFVDLPFPVVDPKIDLVAVGYVSWDMTPPAGHTPLALHVLNFRAVMVQAVGFLHSHDRWVSEALEKPHELELSVGRQFISLFRLLPNEYAGNFFPNTETNERAERRAGLFVTYWKIPVWEREGNEYSDYAVLRDQRGRYVVIQLLNAATLLL